MLIKLREKFERFEVELSYAFKLSLFFSTRYTIFDIPELEILQKWIKVEGMGFEPTNP